MASRHKIFSRDEKDCNLEVDRKRAIHSEDMGS
jgi:hypothetical protein